MLAVPGSDRPVRSCPRGDGRGQLSARSLLAGLGVVGLFGFGGGSALVPVFGREFVDKRRLLQDEQFVRHTIVANITPGALPVKLAAAAGAALGGWSLALVGALVVALPGVAAAVGLLALSDWLGPDAVRVVSYASVGITAFIVVLLAGYIAQVHARAGTRLWVYLAITVASALATGAGELARLAGLLFGAEVDWHPPRLSAVLLIVVALVVIVVSSLLGGRRAARPVVEPTPNDWRRTWRVTAVFVMLVLAGLAVFGLVAGMAGLRTGGLLALSTLTTFGGGQAYIGVADGFFVRDGLVDAGSFYTQLVPIANALPGPILVKIAAGIGYLVGLPMGVGPALLLAAAATMVTIGSACAVMAPVLGAYKRMMTNPVVANIGRYILPVICGLLVSVSATMLLVSAEVGRGAGVAPPLLLWASLAAVGVIAVAQRRRVPDPVLLAVAGTASLVWLLVA